MIAEQAPVVAQFAEDVRAGLSAPRKQLPSKYFYDSLGSALFEAICELPEYGLTKADERVLKRCSPELAALVPENLAVVELGSGSGRKTRLILEALGRQRPVVPYYPIEISASALSACQREMSDLNGVRVKGIENEYLEGLRHVSLRRERGQHMLVLFLGSTIGNFDNGDDQLFLQQVRSALSPGDSLLLGTDMVKPVNKMLSAYDDPTGVTAAFNLNVLARINRELDANFDLRSFEHMAVFNEDTSSVEMHLRSKRGQFVTVPGARCMAHFEQGETIWTECSHKFSEAELYELAARTGFYCERQWTDKEWGFIESLLRVS